jgi:hypothetical protein
MLTGTMLIFLWVTWQVHSSNFNVAVQALMLLHQLMLKNQAVSERFYRALYAILLSSSLTKSSKVPNAYAWCWCGMILNHSEVTVCLDWM